MRSSSIDAPAAPAAPRPHRLRVCCAAGAQAQAAALIGALCQAGAGDFELSTGDLTELPDDTDLLLQIVGDGDMPAALRQLAALPEACPRCAPLVVADHLDSRQWQALLAAGAVDFLCAPVGQAELLLRVQRALGLNAAVNANANARAHDAHPAVRPAHPALRDLIGESPLFAQQVARVPLLAKYDASVLILGDTGTGKEVCAQAIHYLSARAGRPWVAVNCGAIPTELIEAELFGHVKGAYTHAHAARPGLVREAEGGTLFLDEIDALPYGAQAKLLRFLQEKEYRPIGSNTVQHADVRVIAASNRQPAQLASREVFRQDLLYRLNVLTLHLPRLRDRRTDIPQLALHFVRGAAQQWHKPVPLLAPAALKKLLAHDWPGNVRELKNVIERAVLMAGPGALNAHDVDLDGSASGDDEAVVEESLRDAKARVVEGFERSYIEQLLASNGGNVTHAAKAAKKNRRAFFELMRKYKIESDPFRAHAAG